jgi:hypothetical protein
MKIIRYQYEYAGDVLKIDLLVTGLNDKDMPVGYQVWPDLMIMGQWNVDDEQTVLIHPIVHRYTMGRVSSLIAY